MLLLLLGSDAAWSTGDEGVTFTGARKECPSPLIARNQP
jgi:hypothetical protein